MYANYYPKHNLLLVDGNVSIEDAFLCFVDNIYKLQIIDTAADKIKVDRAALDILSICLLDSFNTSTKHYKNIIRQNKIYCKIVFCFNFDKLSKNVDLFRYIEQQTIFKQINSLTKRIFKRKKMYSCMLTDCNDIVFLTEFYEVHQLTGEVEEILSIINSSLT